MQFCLESQTDVGTNITNPIIAYLSYGYYQPYINKKNSYICVITFMLTQQYSREIFNRSNIFKSLSYLKSSFCYSVQSFTFTVLQHFFVFNFFNTFTSEISRYLNRNNNNMVQLSKVPTASPLTWQLTRWKIKKRRTWKC